MPIFEYECGACGRVFETLVMSSAAKARSVACAHCGGRRVTRLFSTFSARQGGASKSGQAACDAGPGAGRGRGPAGGGCGSGSCGCG